MIKKQAFTLAEVLITLSILGVVAAVTVPSIVRNYQDRVQLTQLLKTAAAVDEGLRIAMVENGIIDNWEGIATETDSSNKSDIIVEKMAQYFNIQKFCKRSSANYNSCLQTIIKYKNNTAWNSYKICKSLKGVDGTCDFQVGGLMLLKSGAAVGFSYRCPPNNDCNARGKERYYIGQVYIDTNGKKGPNRLGYDIFLIPYGKRGLYPENDGNPGSGNPAKSNCLSPQGYGDSCGRYVLRYKNMDYKRKNITDIWK